MKSFFLALSICILTHNLVAGNVKIITFKHTARWINESNYPNYFLDLNTRDSIYSDISKNLRMLTDSGEIEFPDKIDYKIIAGFGKPKKEPTTGVIPAGYIVEIFSFLTRATSGSDVFWGVKVIIRNNGKIISDKEAICEVVNANVSSYAFSTVRIISAKEFRKIFSALFAEAAGTGAPVGDKIIVGKIEEKEKQVQSLFPDFEKYILQVNGKMISAGNYSARLVTETDTILEVKYQGTEKSKNKTPVGKAIAANFFSELTKIDFNYTEIVKRTINGKMDFSNGLHNDYNLEYFEKVSRSGTDDEVTSSEINEPLIGRIFFQDSLIGEFRYIQILDTIKTRDTNVKLNLAGGYYTENSFGVSVIHRVTGKIYNFDYTVEYNELFSFSDIKIGDKIIATAIMQNCNPKNSVESGNVIPKKNKINKADRKSLNIDNEYIQDWFPVYFEKDLPEQEIVLAYQMLVSLFFGIGKM